MKAAIYCRLSREDEEKQGAESESIQNQKSMLEEYAAGHGWDVFHVYSDEDRSGADKTRPAFIQMLADAEKGAFEVLLVKTQSRFTRDMELVEKYIHGLLPQWGVRFIAVVDHADTEERGNKKARQINGLVNEWYLEDLSENIRAVLDSKRRAGQYIGSMPLYGYRRDSADKGRLVPDAPACDTVKRIFALYLKGCSTQAIAEQLNREKILNPTAEKMRQKAGWHNGRAGKTGLLWNRAAVRRILENRIYAGDMVQGRIRRESYKSRRLVPVPAEHWMIVPDTHAALVDRETYRQVQEKIRRKGGARCPERKPSHGGRSHQ